MNADYKIRTAHLWGAALVFALLFYLSKQQHLLFLVAILSFSLAYTGSYTGYKPLLVLLVFSLPFSFNYEMEGAESAIRIPSEFFIVIITLAFLIRNVLIEGIDRSLWKHPVSMMLIILLGIQLVTACFSTMPMVSLKAVIIKTLYVMVFYFACAEFFRKDTRNIRLFYLVYALSLCVVTMYTLQRHAEFAFSKRYAPVMAEPFFSDHTIYSTCLVFMIPFVFLFGWKAREWLTSKWLTVVFVMMTGLFTLAVFVSSSRAAWLSFGVMLVASIILFFRIRILHLTILFCALLLYAYLHSEEINNAIRSNHNNSKAITADLAVQAKSITNISNDESNAERINRWKCALRMAEEKPFTGFGPGTYQFQYLRFQKEPDLTAISVFNPYHITKGRGGTAHNEFLLVMSESGIAGFVVFCMLVFYVMRVGYLNLRKGRNSPEYTILFAVYVALISYVFHSLFNNFLDTDKSAFLFYSAMAAMVAIDLRRKEDHGRTSM